MSQTPQTPDDNFVARLRSAYDQHPPHTSPVLPTGRAAVARARSRRGRRAVAVAGAMAVAAAVPLLGAALIDSDGADAGPASPTVGSVGLTYPMRDYPTCAERDLEFSATEPAPYRSEGADGAESASQLVTLSNSSDTVCAVPSLIVSFIERPTRQGGFGELQDVRVAFGPDRRAIVAPGGSLGLLTTAPSCEDPAVTDVGVFIDGGQTSSLETAESVYEGCRPDDLEVLTSSTSTLSLGTEGQAVYRLTGELRDVPDTLSRGEERIALEVANPTDRPVRLDGCPMVQVTSPAGDGGAYPTDCREGSVIEPGDSVELKAAVAVPFAGAGSTVMLGVSGVDVPRVVVPVTDRGRGPAEAGSTRECRADELAVEVGDDLRLPGGRSGRLVRLTTTGDRVCDVAADVRATVSTEPGQGSAPVEFDSVDVRADRAMRIAPGLDVAFMISAERCTDGRGVEDAIRFGVSAGAAGAQIIEDPGTTGTCGGLTVDWVVVEGFDSAGYAYALTGGITVPDGLVIGEPGRIVATVRNPTDRAQAISPCALRVLPGQGMQIADPGDCSEPERIVEPGGSTELAITQQPMGSGVAGRSLAFTVDGVAAPVRNVTIQPRG